MTSLSKYVPIARIKKEKPIAIDVKSKSEIERKKRHGYRKGASNNKKPPKGIFKMQIIKKGEKSKRNRSAAIVPESKYKTYKKDNIQKSRKQNQLPLKNYSSGKFSSPPSSILSRPSSILMYISARCGVVGWSSRSPLPESGFLKESDLYVAKAGSSSAKGTFVVKSSQEISGPSTKETNARLISH